MWHRVNLPLWICPWDTQTSDQYRLYDGLINLIDGLIGWLIDWLIDRLLTLFLAFLPPPSPLSLSLTPLSPSLSAADSFRQLEVGLWKLCCPWLRMLLRNLGTSGVPPVGQFVRHDMPDSLYANTISYLTTAWQQSYVFVRQLTDLELLQECMWMHSSASLTRGLCRSNRSTESMRNMVWGTPSTVPRVWLFLCLLPNVVSFSDYWFSHAFRLCGVFLTDGCVTPFRLTWSSAKKPSLITMSCTLLFVLMGINIWEYNDFFFDLRNNLVYIVGSIRLSGQQAIIVHLSVRPSCKAKTLMMHIMHKLFIKFLHTCQGLHNQWKAKHVGFFFSQTSQPSRMKFDVVFKQDTFERYTQSREVTAVFLTT